MSRLTLLLALGLSAVQTSLSQSATLPSAGVMPDAPGSRGGTCTLLQDDDGTFENAYSLHFLEVAPPDTGAFAKHFVSPFPDDSVLLCDVSFLFTTIPQFPQGSALYTAIVYQHDASQDAPGAELLRISDIDPGPVGIFPNCTEHTVDFGQLAVPREFWIAWWPQWPGAELEWFLCADENGAEPAVVDMVNWHLAPGWIPVENQPEFPNAKNLGIRCSVQENDSEPEALIALEEPADEGCGAYTNATQDTALVCSFTAPAANPLAPFLRVNFDLFDIGDRDFVRFTSVADGDFYAIEGREVPLRPNTYTSYFLNGSQILVELFALPGSSGGGIHASSLDAGIPATPGLEEICGGEDNRFASDDPQVARLIMKKGGKIYVGTGFLISDNGCMLTAGHNLSNPATGSIDSNDPGSVTAQFNVPASDGAGNLNQAKAEDTYQLDTNAPLCSAFSGSSSDYGVFKLAPNAKTGKNAADAAGGHFELATSLPDPSASIGVTGFGEDTNTRTGNHAQQTGFGSYSPGSGYGFTHSADTQGGSSGSPVFSFKGVNTVFGIHTGGGCANGGTNVGTSVLHPGLQACIDSVCTKTVKAPPSGVDSTEVWTQTHIDVPALGGPLDVMLAGTIVVERDNPVPTGEVLEIDTEIVDMQLSGVSCVGPVTVTLDPTVSSFGLIRQGGPGSLFPAESFFDVAILMELGGMTLRSQSPLSLSAMIHSIPPYGSTYEQQAPVPLVDQSMSIAGNILTFDPTFHEPVDRTFTDADLLLDFFGPVEPVLLSGVWGVERGAPFWNGAEGSWDVPVEIVSMDVRGAGPTLGPVVLRESPDLESFGSYIHPDYEEFPANGFFDAFLELELQDTGQVLFNPSPVRLRADPILAIPPTGAAFVNEFPVVLHDQQTGMPVAQLVQDVQTIGSAYVGPPPPPQTKKHCAGMSAQLIVDSAPTLSTFDALGVMSYVNSAPSSGPDGRLSVATELFDLDLADPDTPAGSVGVRTFGLPPSLGSITQSAVGPFFPADSFFDVFIEIEVGSTVLHNGVPIRLSAAIDEVPLTEPHAFSGSIPLLDSNDQPAGELQELTLIPETVFDPNPTCVLTPDCSGASTSVEDPVEASPPISRVALYPANPNPANRTTTIAFDLPASAFVRLRVYDVSGRLVRSLVEDALQGPHRYDFEWDGRNGRGQTMGSGIYFVRLEAPGAELTQKLVLVR